MSKLLNNLPIEDLTEENDYLGIIDKGQIIKTFLESNTEEFKDIKMFALYGEWGSGKSTLMKYLQKELKSAFNTYFFEAWQFEKDDNLSISLLEYLLHKSNSISEEFAGDILKFGGKILRGLGNSIQFNVPLYPNGPSIEVQPSKFVEEFTKQENISFYEAIERFKEEFRKWEDLRNDKKYKDYNIIFIDDLDRCEPENVLNLLSALKLFFTYGQRTVFFCGIDKKAVNEAVRTKYGKVVKANEYLEKIFDVSFNMPHHDDLLKLVSQYFDGREVEIIGGKLNENISFFLTELNFTNPRRVKKLLNKYSMLLVFKKKLDDKHIPNIYSEEGGNYFETVLVLQIILLHEFYPNSFNRLFDLKYKESILVEVVKKGLSRTNYTSYLTTIRHYLGQKMVFKSLREVDLTNRGQFDNLVFAFLPNNVMELESHAYNKSEFYKMKFNKITIEYRFLSYLLSNSSIISRKELLSEISLIEIKDMVKKLL